MPADGKDWPYETFHPNYKDLPEAEKSKWACWEVPHPRKLGVDLLPVAEVERLGVRGDTRSSAAMNEGQASLPVY